MTEPHHEVEDLADHRRGVLVANAIVGGLLAASLVVAWIDARFIGGAPAAGAQGTMPTDALRELREEVETEWSDRADAWEWVDRAHTVARIPVSRAAQLTLERGLPVRSELQRPITARTIP